MSGLKLVIPAAFTDTTLPILRDDPRLNVGSLILADFAHPANPLPSGVPTHLASIPNIAWKEASALTALSNPTNASLPLTYYMNGGVTPTTSTKGKVERTPKGGLHGIISQAVAMASGDGLSFGAPEGIRAYVMANPGHNYYMAAWYRITRHNANPSTKALTMYEFGRANTGGSLGQLNDPSWVYGSGSVVLGSVIGDNTAIGTKRASLGVSPAIGRSFSDAVTTSGSTTVTSATAAFTSADVSRTISGPGIVTQIIATVVNATTITLTTAATVTATGVSLAISNTLAIPSAFNAGPTIGYPVGAANTYNNALISGRNNTAPSFVVYSWQVCDLTAAGLTYAQAEATDLAEFNSAFNTVGGRYYSDTVPTDPSTIA